MTIEICSEKDIPSLVNISIQSYCEHYTYLWNDEGEAYIAENFSASNFKHQLDDKNVAMFLIYDEEVQPCGFLKLNIDKLTKIIRQIFRLNWKGSTRSTKCREKVTEKR